MVSNNGGSTQYSKYSQGNNHAKTSNSSMDDGVLLALTEILSTLEEDGNLKDFEPLKEFFRKGFMVQIVQSWSYNAEVNNQSKFIQFTEILTTLLKLIEDGDSTHECGDTLIQLILTDQIKVLYKGLNNVKPSLTNPTIALMRAMVHFRSGVHVEEFINSFDFSLPSLSKILSISKADLVVLEGSHTSPRLSMRHGFLDFWLELLSLTTPLLRKDLLSENPKIIGNWFKFMDKVDSSALLKHTLDVLIEKVLNEPVFKRMTKTKILNELALSKFHSFYSSPDKELVKKTNDFFLAYGCDLNTSVAFPDDCVWFSESPFNGIRKGATVSINQKEYQVYNKLLFNVLKFFRPWEDEMQATTVTKILDHVPELVPPYCSFLASHGSHDPKMTSYWFGCTLVIGRIIRLKIPSFMNQIETHTLPSTKLVMASILPYSLTKSALTKSLNHENLLIKQLVCQLLVFSFQKLESILHLYDQKGWEAAKSSLRNTFHALLPDLSTITQVGNQIYTANKNNKILQLSLATILKFYSKLFPNFFSISLPPSNIYLDVIHGANLSGMDLAILDNFLQFQEFNGAQMKWWRKTSGKHSIFVSLLALAIKSDTTIQNKVCQLLENMFRGTVTFRKLSCSAQTILIHSLQAFSDDVDSEEMSKVWKLLDETIERCMRIPYKYVDQSRPYGYVSPFVIALVEQWKYIDKSTPYTQPAKWICIYLRTMIMCGESQTGTLAAVQAMLQDIPAEYVESYLGFLKYEESAKRLHDNTYLLSDLSYSSFFELVSLTSYSDLKSLSRYPTNDFDAVGLQYRLQTVIYQEDIPYNTYFEEVASLFIDRLSRYSVVNTSFKFLNSHFIEFLFENISKGKTNDGCVTKSFFVANSMMKLNEEFIHDADFELFAYQWLERHTNFLESSYEHMIRFVSCICKCLLKDHALALLKHHDRMDNNILLAVLERLLKFENAPIPFGVLTEFLRKPSEDLKKMASKFIQGNKVSEMNTKVLLPLILGDDDFSIVVDSFVRSEYFSKEAMLPYLDTIKDENTSLIIALAIEGCDDEGITGFVSQVVEKSISSIRNLDMTTTQKALELFCSNPHMLNETQKDEILGYILKDFGKKYNSSVISFAITFADFENPSVLKWLGKLSLFLTREFAKVQVLSAEVPFLLSELQRLMKTINIWDNVSHVILNSQLETIISCSQVSNPQVLEYVAHLLLSSSPASIECAKLVQCFLNNDSNALGVEKRDCHSKNLSAAILLILFQLSPQECSNVAVQRILLTYYSGSLATSDRIILKVLEIIESNTYSSWTNDVIMWDMVDEENKDDSAAIGLVSSEKDGLIVSLRLDIIENTARNYVLNRPFLPTLTALGVDESWESLLSFFRQNERAMSNIEGITYDPLFLLLTTIHNEELVRKIENEDGSVNFAFNLQAFLNSKVFQVIICALADESTINSIASSLLVGILNSLEEKDDLKDNTIFKVLLKRIFVSLQKDSSYNEAQAHTISPCIWMAISSLCDQLVNPASPLYEKSYRWVLSCPFIRYNDLPLLQELMITTNSTTTELEHYYKQLSWVLETLNLGIKTTDDVALFKKKGILEWLSNLMNVPYLNPRMSSCIKSIFFAAQRLENGGSTLITRAASISHLEIHSMALLKKLERLASGSSPNKKELKKSLAVEQERLNLKEILEGHTIILNSQKRLGEWIEGDTKNIQKRLKR